MAAGFLYVKVPEASRGRTDQHRLHAAIEQALASSGAGSLVGWGASVGEPDGRGLRRPAHHRLDVEVTDLARGLADLQQALRLAEAPHGTEIHGHRAGAVFVQVWGPGGWSETPHP